MPKKKNDRFLIWIKIAKSDLKSAQLLYKNSQYRNSYYFFQQASEKALKAYSLKHEITSEKELRNVSHDVFKLFKIFVDKKEQKISSVKETLNSDDLKKITELKESQNQLTEAKKAFDASTNEEIINTSLDDLDSMLREFKDSFFYNLKLPKTYGKKAREKISTFLSWLEKSKGKIGLRLKHTFEMVMEDEETTKDLYEIFVKFTEGISVGYAISVCAFVTAKHNNLTRYPDQELNPLNLYSRDLPIIQKQPEFMRILSRALKNI